MAGAEVVAAGATGVSGFAIGRAEGRGSLDTGSVRPDTFAFYAHALFEG